MTQETQRSETVRAIWNRDLTLKICLGEDIVQEETPCECCADHHGTNDGDDMQLSCQELAWPRYEGAIVVCGDGRAHFCEECIRDLDPDFVDLYEEVFSLMLQFATATGERVYTDDEMERMAAHFPPGEGVIEYGPPLADR